jgi:hypothetical protein
MYFVLIAIVLGVGSYLYHWFYRPDLIPVLSAKNNPTVKYEAVVPLAMPDEITLELGEDFEKEWEQYKPVLIEEADTVLLLEAEKLITEVEAIAVSKEDVLNKLQQLIPGFALLHKTEYYEPCNKFIFLTVQRECGLELTEKELAALWV